MQWNYFSTFKIGQARRHRGAARRDLTDLEGH